MMRDLVRRCLDGDESAWQDLVEHFTPLILSIPRRYGLDATATDDVFSEVCLTLVRSLHSLRDAQALPQWIIRTTSRAAWEISRKARIAPPDDLPPLTGAAPPDEVMELFEEEQIVRDALSEVSERCRRLLQLLYFAVPTPSYDDVAARMEMPRGSLGPTRRRCLERLRKELAPKLGGGVSGARRHPPEE